MFVKKDKKFSHQLSGAYNLSISHTEVKFSRWVGEKGTSLAM